MMRKMKVGPSAKNVENGFMTCLVFMVNVLPHFHVTFVKILMKDIWWPDMYLLLFYSFKSCHDIIFADTK